MGGRDLADACAERLRGHIEFRKAAGGDNRRQKEENRIESNNGTRSLREDACARRDCWNTHKAPWALRDYPDLGGKWHHERETP